MEEPSNNIQRSRRSFLRLSIATNLLVTPLALFSKYALANETITPSNKPNRNLKMSKKVILEFKVKKEIEKQFMEFLDRNLANVRAFDGCSQVEVYYNSDNSEMIIDEVWASVDHHQKYLAFITKNGVMSELASFLESKPEIKYFDAVNL